MCRVLLLGVIASVLTSLSLPKTAFAIEYWVVVHTGEKEGAGTDANVEIKITGSKATSAWTDLNEKGNDRERGNVNIYVLNIGDVGEIRKVQLRAREDKKNASRPDWYLESVTIHMGSIKNEVIALLKGAAKPSPVGTLELDLGGSVNALVEGSNQKARHQFLEALKKLPGTKEIVFEAWVNPGKHAARGTPQEWIVIEKP